MNKNIKNMAASVKARLKNIARDEKINFNQVLLLYLQERLLYRLSISKYSSNFLLKGGVLILFTMGFKTRPTKDIDFLAEYISNNPKDIKNILQEICNVNCNDGVEFDADSIKTEEIVEGAGYEGVRVKLDAYLGNASRKLQLDIGFGDIVVPEAQKLDYPGLLDLERPKINAYSIESVIAEKFESMIRLGKINSRMKDFYDIYTLANSRSFDGRVLQEAISETFQKRGTPLEEKVVIFTDEFISNNRRIKMWEKYLRRIGKGEVDFKLIMQKIKVFLSPIYQYIINEDEFFKYWDCEKLEWKGKNQK